MTQIEITDLEAHALLQAAASAARHAYAPYSHFSVGAALWATDADAPVLGVNVENASYGLTLCAERAAIVSAISRGMRQFKAIAVWATERPYGAITPCGACRQVLAEFLGPEGRVIFADATTGNVRQLPLKALLPEAFGLALDESCQGIDSSKPGG